MGPGAHSWHKPQPLAAVSLGMRGVPGARERAVPTAGVGMPQGSAACAWPCSPTSQGSAGDPASSGHVPVGSRVQAPREAAAPPDPASALLPGSSMFRAPCMSQRRLALIFCISVLIVLLIALILLCEWGPSPGDCGSAEPGGTGRELQGKPPFPSHVLPVPGTWWTRRSGVAGEEPRWGPCGPGWGGGLRRAALLWGLLRWAPSALRPAAPLSGLQRQPRTHAWCLGVPHTWQTSSGVPPGWVTAPSPPASPCHQPQPYRSVRLLPVMFWRSQTGIVYKEPAESCKDSPVRCDGVVDCSQRSDELDCGEAPGAGAVGARGAPGCWVPLTRPLHPRSALRVQRVLAPRLLQRREPVAVGVQQRLGRLLLPKDLPAAGISEVIPQGWVVLLGRWGPASPLAWPSCPGRVHGRLCSFPQHCAFPLEDCVSSAAPGVSVCDPEV